MSGKIPFHKKLTLTFVGFSQTNIFKVGVEISMSQSLGRLFAKVVLNYRVGQGYLQSGPSNDLPRYSHVVLCLVWSSGLDILTYPTFFLQKKNAQQKKYFSRCCVCWVFLSVISLAFWTVKWRRQNVSCRLSVCVVVMTLKMCLISPSWKRKRWMLLFFAWAVKRCEYYVNFCSSKRSACLRENEQEKRGEGKNEKKSRAKILLFFRPPAEENKSYVCSDSLRTESKNRFCTTLPICGTQLPICHTCLCGVRY